MVLYPIKDGETEKLVRGQRKSVACSQFVRYQTLPFASESNVAQAGLNTEDSLQLLIQLSGAREYMCVS